jgi:hypothetical protein
MQELSLIRRIELFFWIGICVLYVTRLLWLESHQWDKWEANHEINRISPYIIEGNRAGYNLLKRDLEGYNYVSHMALPIVAGAILLLAAWYLFHYLAYPKIKAREFDERTVAYLVLVVLLATASVFVYYFFKLNMRFKHDEAGEIIGMKFYSLYRKTTVLSESIGVLILLGVYELSIQVYYSLHQKLSQETLGHLTYFSYFILASIGACILIVALNGYIPATLWNEQSGKVLLVCGLLVQVYVLQNFLWNYLFPYQHFPLSTPFISHATIYLFMAIGMSILLWGAYTNWKYMSASLITIMYGAPVLVSYAVMYLRLAVSREKTMLQTQVSRKTAELSSLRSQINPHFLFNALNSLYATALKENGEKTAEGIQKLGDMMRFMLEENNQERIPLFKEVEYLHNYIQLQRMRLDESQGIDIRIHMQEPAQHIYIAPMLLNPFVENAFKHGISFLHPSWIYITLTLDTDRLYFKVHNSLHSAHDHDPEESKSGVGLENVKKRLELIYPKQYTLDIQQSQEDYFVSLTLHY